MEPVTLLIALVAGGAVLLIVYALSSGSAIDPVQARLTQLGTMEAKNLEELELQAPFIERTLRPLGAALSGRLSRSTNQSMSEKTEKRLALAGNPAERERLGQLLRKSRGKRSNLSDREQRRVWELVRKAVTGS